MSSRTREVALLLLVLLLAGGMASLTGTLSSPVIGVRVLIPTQVSTGTGISIEPGTLVLQVEYVQIPASGLAPAPSIGHLAVVLTKDGQGPLSAVTYTTNSSGFLVQSLDPANYSITLYHYIVNASTQVQILNDTTTSVLIRVAGASYEPQFTDIPVGQSLTVQPWTPLTMEVPGLLAFDAQTSYFLDVYYPAVETSPVSSSLPLPPLQVPSLAQSSSAVNQAGSAATNGTSDVWLTVQPETSFILLGATDLELAVYITGTTVTMHGN